MNINTLIGPTVADVLADPTFWSDALDPVLDAIDPDDPGDWSWTVCFEACTMPGLMVNKKSCKYCHFWRRENREFYTKLDGGNHRGNCENEEKFVYALHTPACPRDGLIYWDFEGYLAGFSTGEDFCCVHFKERVPR